ncbi:MAG: hydantoinase B/oxoprolinase family protein [Thermogemmatispora sp.]|uniref:hydantoinase B/oxoprolinase family protein n=1 Tax=Thermogemmatispora sp. TaxID=1968838 RepID=UPI00262616A0|nr:hydantoinase B/oxoprolinase family protein [Thermogemmatispora sp.]MBX5459240.1 hydantoinase B/oxoprolinase family protein [Thermogemmatispora sp.]
MVDAISLEIFRSALTAIAEEMGAVLMRSSYSPNIKERRDFSCALFDARGRLVAQAAHIPVHLGSMPDSVAEALVAFDRFAPGDIIALNDPFLGGTHLPDITLIAPIFVEVEEEQRLIGFAANRAHHADVGGMAPGSMPLATEIYQEGLIIPPLKLWEAGQPNRALLALLLRNVRTPDERRGDLAAQVAANRTAARRLQELVDRWGLAALEEHVDALIEYAARMARATIAAIPDGSYRFTDYLDDDGVSGECIPITVTVTVRGSELTVDFTGSAPQVRGNVNTVASVARSATYYVVRCLMPEDAPMNHGTFAPVTVIAPRGSVVNARPPAAVAQGNVETSQRLVDAIFGALAQALPEVVPAASQGTMNNIAAGGIDPRTQQPFAYYETMGGGMGARPGLDGLSGVHTHMSNTLNTPVEAFEYAYPMRITRYALRDGSGGAGRARGGDGLVREITFEAPAEVTLLTERRRLPPYGLQGGEPGRCGENWLYRRAGEVTLLPGKVHFRAEPGDRLVIASPGGGGWGRAYESPEAAAAGSAEPGRA